jgi:hypothetical protein
MPDCYYTCNLVPPDLLVRNGYTPRWLGNHLRDANAPVRREALSVHPMTCPYVTKLVAAAGELFGSGGSASTGDRLVVPGGCDAARRMGDLLAAAYPGRVFVLPVPRSAEPAVVNTVAGDLRRLDEWLSAAPAASPDTATPETCRYTATPDTCRYTAAPAAAAQKPPAVDYPSEPTVGGVFVVAGPLTDSSLLELILKLGATFAGLESCTSPDRWRSLADLTAAGADSDRYVALATGLLDKGMCPRRSTVARREYLVRRLDEMQPSSIIYARQSFCDPGAYDSLLVAQLAKERGLPYLEIEVDFPFDANGPLRTRVEAFLEAQLLDEDLLRDHRELEGESADLMGGGRQNGAGLDDDLLGDDLFGED